MNETPILIVEDEAVVAADLASKLGRLGYPVVGTVARGAEAITLVRERRPALVLMDIRIAGPMDGVETAENIRRECDVPVIYLTAHSDQVTLQRAKLTEPFGYILKPFDERELEICLQMALFKHQTQRQLSESEARFRTAFEDGAIAMAMTGLDTTLQKINPAFCNLLGYTAEDLVGHSFAEFTHPDDVTPNRVGIQRMLTGEIPSFRMEQRYLRKDGSLIWTDMSTAAIRDSSGKPLYIVTHVQDITGRKRAEDALRSSAVELQAANQALSTSRRAALNLMTDAQSARRQAERISIELEKREEQLRIFVEHAPAAIAMLDTDMRYVATSRRWLADFGLTGKEVLGRSHYDIFPEISEEWKAIHRRCLAGAVERAEEDPFDRADGTRQWIHWEIHPWNVAPGTIGGIVIFSEDITPRKKAEQALRESEERYRSLFRSMTEGFAIHEIITDADGQPVDYRFLDINPAFERLTGLKRADVVGKTLSKVLPGEDPKWVRMYGSVALTGEPVHMENYSPLLQRYFEVFAYCPASHQFAVIFMDITERKKSEARIARLTQLYAVLSRVNEAIFRFRDEHALYGEVCRVIAEEGHFPLVWIGLLHDRQIVPTASAGPSADYLKTIRVEVDGPLGLGPSGTCIREDRAVVNADFDANPATAPWREPALRYGFRASASVPLRRQGQPIGALTLYATEPEIFDAEQVRLIDALGSDLSYALDAIAQEQLRAEVETSLRASEKREKEDAIRLAWGQSAIDTINVMHEGVTLLEMDGTILSINPAVERLTGLTGGAVVGRNLQSLLPDFLEKAELRRTLRRLAVFRRGRIPELPTLHLRRSDGKILYVLPSLSLMKMPEGERRVAVLTLTDVTELHESAKRLEQSERKYRELVENASSIIMRITCDHTITFFNEYAQRLFGYAEDEVLGHHVVGTIAPAVDSAGRDLSAMFQSITADPEKYASNENENICKDGRRIWVHWTNRAVRNDRGKLIEFLCVGTDITERRQAEMRTKATNAMLALFARQTTRSDYLSAVTDLLKELVGCRCVGVRIRNAFGEIPYEASTGFDAQFLESESKLQLGRDECACSRIVSARPLSCDRSSLSPGGSFFCNDTPTMVGSLSSADRGLFRGMCVKRGFASIAILPIRFHDETLGAIHLADERSGAFSLEVINFMETIVPLIGEAVHRFNVEAELRKNEARYRSLVVASSQIVWSTNAAGEVADDLPFWRAYTGQSREEIMGWGWTNVIHAEDRRRATDAWAQAVSTRSLYDSEFRIRAVDGEYRDFAVRGVPVIDPDGALREWVGTCTDITQRKGMEAEAVRYREQLRALAKELVASEEQERWQISRYIHDTIIQNLSLSSMRLGAFLKKLSATPGDTEGPQIATTRKLVDDAIAECRTVMSELTPPLLNELGLVPALEELVDTLQQRHGIPIEVENEGLSKPMDIALRGLLFQSARELIMNALKHAGPCSIRVIVADTADGIRIRVQDNGRGFDPARKKSRDTKKGGFGLFSVRERVEGMGGQLAIESAPGQGVTATIALPLPESG